MNDLDSKIRRYRGFYESRRPGDLLIVVRNGWPSAPKNLFDYEFDRGGHVELANDIVDAAERMIAQHGDLDDDFIPFVMPDLGIAAHLAFLVDVPIRFAEWTSWAPHPLEGPGGLDRLGEIHYDPKGKWALRIKEMVQVFRDRCQGQYLFNTHLHFGPLDLANAIRGNELFTDFYDYPDQVRRLLDVCTDAIIRFEEDLRAVAGPTWGRDGIPLWGALAPRGSVFLSEDAMDMIGPVLSA